MGLYGFNVSFVWETPQFFRCCTTVFVRTGSQAGWHFAQRNWLAPQFGDKSWHHSQQIPCKNMLDWVYHGLSQSSSQLPRYSTAETPGLDLKDVSIRMLANTSEAPAARRHGQSHPRWVSPSFLQAEFSKDVLILGEMLHAIPSSH